MTAFPDWTKFAVQQKRPKTGCIPTGFEMLLRAAGATGIDFTSFQDDFDLDQYGGRPRNHFVSVGDAIRARYPGVDYKCETFRKGEGAAKLKKVEALIAQKKPILVSLTLTPAGWWHIMPVVDSDSDSLFLLRSVDVNGLTDVQTVTKSDFVFRHDHWAGGEEIAYIVSC